MKKKLLAIIGVACVLCLSAVLLAGCGGASTESASEESAATEETASTAASTEATDDSADITDFIVGFDQSYPPYGFVGDDGEYTGFDLDLAQAVCEKNGWNLQLEAIDWDAKDALIESGAITCIWNGFTMEGREDNYTFSDPYMLNGQVIVTAADSDINSLEDLAGKAVVTQVDSAALDVLEGDQADLAATFASLDTIADYNNAFVMLQSGQVDAVACDLSIAEYQMAANEGMYKQLDETLSDEHYAVGFLKGNDALAQKVTETLKQLNEDGTVQELCDKYSEYGISYENWLIK